MPPTTAAAVRAALAVGVETAGRPTLRIGAPIMSLVLSSSLDTHTSALGARGIRAWVETDRRDERRDGWTVERVGVSGRWCVFDRGSETLAWGSSSSGSLDERHPVWNAIAGGPPGVSLHVRAWQRVDRTAWVVHDGDGGVLAELLLDEQRAMGTHESFVEARLVVFEAGPLHHQLKSALIGCFGKPPTEPGLLLAEGPEERQLSAATKADSAQRSDDHADDHAGSPGTPPDRVGRTGERSDPAKTTDLSWFALAAVEVDRLAQSDQFPRKRQLQATAALVGASAVVRATIPAATAPLAVCAADFELAERNLVAVVDRRWALDQLRRCFEADSADFPNQLSAMSLVPNEPLEQLAKHGTDLRSAVLAVLDPSVGLPTNAIADALVERLHEAVGAWVSESDGRLVDLGRTRHPRRSHRHKGRDRDDRESDAVEATLRTALAAVRFADVHPKSLSAKRNGAGLLLDVERSMRAVRRGAALVAVVEQAVNAVSLSPDAWMRIGVRLVQAKQERSAARADLRRSLKRLDRGLRHGE